MGLANDLSAQDETSFAGGTSLAEGMVIITLHSNTEIANVIGGFE